MSRIESFDPPAIPIAGVKVALVQATRLALPEFDPVGHDPESRPELRPRHIPSGEFFLIFGHPLVERCGSLDRPALPGSPGANLAATFTSREVGIRFTICNFRNTSFDSNLSVQRRPVKAERGFRLRQQLAALSPFVIRVENETALVDPLEQNYAHRRLAIAV